MSGIVYSINKGINRPVEFRGLQAQYIWWLGGGLVSLLVVFAVLYFTGVNTYVALALILGGGIGLFSFVYRLSNRYGEYGMMKKIARRRIPHRITARRTRIFYFQQNLYGKNTG